MHECQERRTIEYEKKRYRGAEDETSHPTWATEAFIDEEHTGKKKKKETRSEPPTRLPLTTWLLPTTGRDHTVILCNQLVTSIYESFTQTSLPRKNRLGQHLASLMTE